MSDPLHQNGVGVPSDTSAEDRTIIGSVGNTVPPAGRTGAGPEWIDRPVRPEPYPATRSAEEWKAFLRDLQRGWGGRWAAAQE